MDAIIVGAGPAGLASAAMLKRQGFHPIVLERSDQVGSAWRSHYDRLHLHTHRTRSGLPGHPMPKTYPRYPSRAQVVSYLEDYARNFGIRPLFESEVTSVHQDQGWSVKAGGKTHRAKVVVIASGPTTTPFSASWPGLDSFPGEVIHSSEYRNPAAFIDKQVLVVGFGNSGGEIAIDLVDKGIPTALSVRGPVNVIPQEVFGIPTTSLVFLQTLFSPAIADALTAPVIRAFTGDIEKLGLQQADKGPVRQVLEDGRVPLIDIGTLARLRDGRLVLRRGIDKIEERKVVFSDGQSDEYDAILMATGYRVDLRQMLPDAHDLLSPEGAPLNSGAASGRDGLFFCSFRQSPMGQLYAMGQEAQAIAAAAVAHTNRPGAAEAEPGRSDALV
ncbi:NAD(P)/FAD-dependent oxidoreductase [Pseudooceanicola sp.]|uniref:flavin-containing monooxygenase n=1 Tax=Pseudooceanicola sp. TaxID=1914328 RepID=UPI0026129688|nr:NAD(P)/FAD-dependent oxidoreductase [Pseudooceanicola sp.]MDF1856078.1 NAD(P)/FAD-dependent oxidoreductase [Pseudooceanicola sp.]